MERKGRFQLVKQMASITFCLYEELYQSCLKFKVGSVLSSLGSELLRSLSLRKQGAGIQLNPQFSSRIGISLTKIFTFDK